MSVVNLPGQLTPFIGRTSELREITALLQDPNCRLLTLIGPGGIGKTRLAIEAARNVLEHFNDGLYFVKLDPLSAPDLIYSAAAEAMNFQLYSGSDRETQFLSFLQDKSALLLLDNFEHLLDGAGLVSRMLETAPGLKIIVTSRERLNLHEEWLYDVNGLHYPGDSVEDARNYSAVQLFAERARRINPNFSLNAEINAVIAICRMVEGMPLAIELASSWGRVLTYSEIVGEIADGLDILETETRNIPARHRSMRAVMDRSWQYLTEAEQGAISHLAIFKGGFTREAAEAVVQANPRLLAALVDKSWLRHEVGSERYTIHELVRQYALEQLTCAEEADNAMQNHLAYFTDFMLKREHDIKCGQQIAGLSAIEQDFENIRTAWNHAIQQRDAVAPGKMQEALSFYCDMKARFSEGEELFRTAADAFKSSTDINDRLIHIGLQARRFRMIVLGSLVMFDDFNSFLAEMEAGIAFVRQHGTAEQLAYLLYISAMLCDQISTGFKLSQESARIYQSLGDDFYYADVRAWEAVLSSDRHTSKQILQETAALQRRIGDLNGLSWSLHHLSGLAFGEHHFEEADQYLNEAIEIQRERGDLKGLYWSKMNISQRKFQLGDFETARIYAAEGRRLATNLKLVVLQQSAIAMLGLIAASTGTDYLEGKRLCEEALITVFGPHFDCIDGPLDALMGLVVAAYQQNDYEAARHNYDRLDKYMHDIEINHLNLLFTRLAPPAALVLTMMGEFTQATEILSSIVHVPDEPGYPVVTWIAKMPLIENLKTHLRTQLGDSVFEYVWEQGSHIPISEIVRRLSNGLQLSEQTLAVVSQDALTSREMEILRLAAKGLSNNQIADQLVLSSGTVKWYLSEIYSKLAVSNRAHAIAKAHELRLISA